MPRTSKRITTTIDNRAALETAIGEYASCEHQAAALKAELETRITNIRTEYEQRFAALANSRDEAFADIAAWAALHPEEFADRKSIDCLHGALGFRTGTPKVAWPKGTTDATAVDLLDSRQLQEFVRVAREPDKDKIRAEFAAEAERELDERTRDPFSYAKMLADAGIKIKQDERFYIDVKTEEVGE